MEVSDMSDPGSIASAKQKLGIERLVLQIHDGSFPSDPEEDCGRGTPYSRGAERFFAFAADLGFDTIQLGPQGMTQPGNASPYDATLFSRNPLNLPLARLVDEGRLSRKTFDSIRIAPRSEESQRPPYSVVYNNFKKAVAEIAERADATDREASQAFLVENSSWLVPDALYGVICAEHNAHWWGEWNRTTQGAFDQRLFRPAVGDESAATHRLRDLNSKYADVIEDYALIQWLLVREHQALRTRLKSLNLSLFADLQVGLSPQDTWAQQNLFFANYRMGAPPSRTNPAGQPWGYSVLDPRQFGTLNEPGPVLQFVQSRVRETLNNYDGLRIDHPHGWIDPWVYSADDPDPFHAVQNGARLFSSPDEANHPELSSCSIARPDQIDGTQPLYGDHHVRSLEESQVARYSMLVDIIVARASEPGDSCAAIACEILSTLPYPIQRVLERHGLGRFRVTQKAKLDDPTDVYRIENARPEDWIMLGTHDTATIWELAGTWSQSSEGLRWGEYLSSLLARDSAEKSLLAQQIAVSSSELIHQLFTAMLASNARQVAVFYPDLFGLTERYNQPGLVSEENWSLRLPHDFDQQYAERRTAGQALDVARCLRLGCLVDEK